MNERGEGPKPPKQPEHTPQHMRETPPSPPRYEPKHMTPEKSAARPATAEGRAPGRRDAPPQHMRPEHKPQHMRESPPHPPGKQQREQGKTVGGEQVPRPSHEDARASTHPEAARRASTRQAVQDARTRRRDIALGSSGSGENVVRPPRRDQQKGAGQPPETPQRPSGNSERQRRPAPTARHEQDGPVTQQRTPPLDADGQTPLIRVESPGQDHVRAIGTFIEQNAGNLLEVYGRASEAYPELGLPGGKVIPEGASVDAVFRYTRAYRDLRNAGKDDDPLIR